MRWPQLGATLAGLFLALACPPAQADGPVLWSVAGRVNTVYLFGSVHLLRPGDYEFGDALAEAYDDAEVVYLEVDLQESSPLDMAAVTLSRAVDPDGRTLFELLGPDADLALERAGHLDMDLAPLGQFEPWFAGLSVVALALAEQGYSADAGIERLVQSRAIADGKPTLGLETLDEQLALLDTLDPVAQREFLLKSLSDAARARETVQQLVAAWRAGDTDWLAREFDEEFSAAPALYDSLVASRNRRWAERIEALLDDERDYLVVVGALHLVGPDGLPRLLAAHGAEVTLR